MRNIIPVEEKDFPGKYVSRRKEREIERRGEKVRNCPCQCP